MKIPINKFKVALLLLGALSFVLAGIWMFSNADDMGRYQPLVTRLISIAVITFFGLCFLAGFLMLFSNEPGMIINETGITNNSLVTGKQIIEWDNIRRLQVIQIKSTKVLLVFVKKPDVVIQRASLPGRILLRLSHRFYQTPVSLGTTIYNINFDDLIKIILQYKDLPIKR